MPEPSPVPGDWPEPPTLAMHGLAGRAVELIKPHSEADPVAVLMHFLAAFGNAIGPNPHALVGATAHRARIWGICVGTTSKGRKGEAWSPVRHLYQLADEQWTTSQVKSGLSTGEGLIHQVRDRVERQQKNRDGEFEMVEIDPGVTDKRLFVLEAEMGRVLKVMEREGSTLTAVIREAWDGDSLHVMTKLALASTGHQIGIMGHITADELRRELDDTSKADGFANRFIWVLIRRSKELPIPEPFAGAAVEKLADDLKGVIQWATCADCVQFNDEAATTWRAGYSALSASKPGLLGFVLNRSEAQVLRLSMVYALLDRSILIRQEHLLAALDLWKFSERSAAAIFGEATGDPMADVIDREARMAGELTRTEISGLLGRNATSTRIDQAVTSLETAGRGQWRQRTTGGRPARVWVPA